MIKLVWDDKFQRIFKKWSVQHPDLVPLLAERRELFVSDSFHPSLKSTFIERCTPGVMGDEDNLGSASHFQVHG